MFTQFLIIIFISSPSSSSSSSSAFDFVSATVSVLAGNTSIQHMCVCVYDVWVWLLWMCWSEKKDEEHSSVCVCGMVWCGMRCGFSEHLNFGGQFGFILSFQPAGAMLLLWCLRCQQNRRPPARVSQSHPTDTGADCWRSCSCPFCQTVYSHPSK